MTKIVDGTRNWLTPVPDDPNVVQPVPVMSSIRTIRLLPASTTKIRPAVSIAIPPIRALVQLNWLAPEPAVLACLVPARRAARLDPAVILRDS